MLKILLDEKVKVLKQITGIDLKVIQDNTRQGFYYIKENNFDNYLLNANYVECVDFLDTLLFEKIK